MPHVLTDPDGVTPEWLTDVLRRDRPSWEGSVTAVKIEFARTLPYSRAVRLKISYSDRPADRLPDHLFLKLSASSTGNEKPADRGSEVDFYGSVAPEMPGPPLVHCYDAQFSPDHDSSHILLEDLTGSHFQPEQGQHPSMMHGGAAVRSLARFHAYWWDHPNLGSGVGKFFDKSWLDSFVGDLEVSVTNFIEDLGDGLTAERRGAYERMLLFSRTIWGRLTNPAGLTVTHGDMHWWNFFHPKDPDHDETRIFDWQLWHIDQGPRDLAFLIALGGFAERRPELEHHLLRTYYNTLVDRGVRDYTWTDFWDDYRRSAIRNLNIPVIFRSQGKHPSTWQRALERAFQSYNELKCSDLL